MTGPEILDLARDGIFTLLKVSAPTMLVGLGVGLVISLFQALTQIQEQTLAFVPKILLMFLTLILTMPFMSDAMASYMTRVAARIATGL